MWVWVGGRGGDEEGRGEEEEGEEEEEDERVKEQMNDFFSELDMDFTRQKRNMMMEGLRVCLKAQVEYTAAHALICTRRHHAKTRSQICACAYLPYIPLDPA